MSDADMSRKSGQGLILTAQAPFSLLTSRELTTQHAILWSSQVKSLKMRPSLSSSQTTWTRTTTEESLTKSGWTIIMPFQLLSTTTTTLSLSSRSHGDAERGRAACSFDLNRGVSVSGPFGKPGDLICALGYPD